MIRILIADDHEIVRHGLADILDNRLGDTVIGEARDAEGGHPSFVI
jgi:YesN/AraC family two-component response regulator